jgi:hypothetical protein
VLGLNDFDCGLITGSCRVRIFPRDRRSIPVTINQVSRYSPSQKQPSLVDREVRFAGCFTNSAPFTRSSKSSPMGGPYWEITLAERAFFNSSAGLYGIR